MTKALEKNIDEFFTKPVDGRKFLTSFEMSEEGVKESDSESDPEMVEIAAGFGVKWLDSDTFFGAIKHFTGAKEVQWGPSLLRDNWTDGEIHKCITIDGNLYEYRGNWYERGRAKTFVKEFAEGTVKPYKK